VKNKKQRQAEATERLTKYESLTIDQKISRAKNRRGESKKELEKLKRLKEKNNKN
jgi:hypothetical protein